MVQLKNKQTGEILEVNNTKREGDMIVGRYEFGTRFYNKYGHVVYYVKSEDGKPYFELADGWEFAETKRQPKTKEQPKREREYKPEAEAEIIEETTKEEKQQPRTELPKQNEVVNAFAALTPLFAGVEANVTAHIMEKVQPLLDRVPQTIRHEIIRPDGSVFESTEVFHPNFNFVCNAVENGLWIYLYGPTGSGKNVLAEQVAKALGLDFYYQAHVTDRFELTGFIDAAGSYHETELYKAATKGGLLFVDELDGSDENALITLNSLANGYFAFPCGTIKVHPNFRIIAGGNTCGRGATEEYTGRRVMDASSLCRFVPRYHGYCREVDIVSAHGDEELVDFFEDMRHIKSRFGVAMLLSPRQLKYIKTIESLGESIEKALRDTITTYLTEDDLEIVKKELDGRDNKYAVAFRRINKTVE